MSRFTAWVRSNRLTASLIGGGVVLVVGAVAFLGVAKATDSPSFCRAACHEMAPFHAAWAQGPHKNIACVECHVDAGEAAQLMHKFAALKEVVEHFSGDTSFPRAEPPSVPNARCLRCHPHPDPKIPGFDHAKHAGDKLCSTCHSKVGHEVTNSALQQAGFLGRVVPIGTGASTDSTHVVVDGGSADLPGHKTVVCSRCHIMSKTPCSSCHTPKHVARGECSTCHRPAEKFVFIHPLAGVDCASCHKPPAVHTTATDCTRCHEKPGVSWAYAHTKGAQCASCHVRPAQHRTGSCATCHKKPGVAWTFSHPANGVNCAKCHPRPAQHRSGTCAVCHRSAGKSWAFSHPRQGANCAGCHSRPAKHNPGDCATCHRRPGVAWTFSHPGLSANCRSCHARPAGMPAGQCSNCHKQPGVNWSFTHAGIRGGKHTSKSFPCVNCHPSGYSTHTCIKCHSSAAGG